MEKSKLRMLVLAAATIAPHLVALSAESVQAKPVKQLSVEELRTAKRPEVYCISSLERKGPNR
jgi:hypothetical protein